MIEIRSSIKVLTISATLVHVATRIFLLSVILEMRRLLVWL